VFRTRAPRERTGAGSVAHVDGVNATEVRSLLFLGTVLSAFAIAAYLLTAMHRAT